MKISWIFFENLDEPFFFPSCHQDFVCLYIFQIDLKFCTYFTHLYLYARDILIDLLIIQREEWHRLTLILGFLNTNLQNCSCSRCSKAQPNVACLLGNEEAMMKLYSSIFENDQIFFTLFGENSFEFAHKIVDFQNVDNRPSKF